jgi:hypothetical protein
VSSARARSWLGAATAAAAAATLGWQRTEVKISR